MYGSNWMGFSDPHMLEGMKEAVDQLPERPVHSMAKGIRRMAQKSGELLASFGNQDDCPDAELTGNPHTEPSL